MLELIGFTVAASVALGVVYVYDKPQETKRPPWWRSDVWHQMESKRNPFHPKYPH